MWVAACRSVHTRPARHARFVPSLLSVAGMAVQVRQGALFASNFNPSKVSGTSSSKQLVGEEQMPKKGLELGRRP